MEIQPQFGIVGFIVGFLVGLTGMGGAAIMTPLLILLFGVRPVTAVGTDLVYLTVTKFFGAWQHYRQDNVDYRITALLAAGSIPGALAGMLLIILFADSLGLYSDLLVTRLIAAVLVLVGISILSSLKIPTIPTTISSKRMLLTPLLGTIGGFLVTLTSVGSGSLFLAMLVALFPIPLRRIVGTDVLHGFILVTVAGLAHIWAENVDFPLAMNLLVGSIPGVIIGSKLTMVLDERNLRIAIGIVLLGLAVRLIL